jgi:hypothetical protein
LNQERLNNPSTGIEYADAFKPEFARNSSAVSHKFFFKLFSHEDEIMKEYEALKGGRREKKIEEIAIEKCGFYLPFFSRLPPFNASYSFIISSSCCSYFASANFKNINPMWVLLT